MTEEFFWLARHYIHTDKVNSLLSNKKYDSAKQLFHNSYSLFKYDCQFMQCDI